MTSKQRQNWIIALPVIALLLWSVIYPNVAVIVGSFENGLGHWREFINSPADREALRTSIVISVASVFASLAIGVPLAFLLGRFEFPGRRLLRAVATLPAALPPLVGVIAFLFLYGESGVVTRAIQRSFGMVVTRKPPDDSRIRLGVVAPRASRERCPRCRRLCWSRR